MSDGGRDAAAWRQEVSEQLVRLNARHDALGQTLEHLEDRLKVLNHLLTGNGDPSKGLIVRIDRIEQDTARRQVWVRAAIGSSVAAIFGFAGVLIKMAFGGSHH